METQGTSERILQLLRDNKVPERAIRRELAELCGISQQAVAQWFDKSTRRISPEYLAKIALRFGSTVDYLITGKHVFSGDLPEDIELDRLFGMLFAREAEFGAEHYAALQVLADRLRARAAARFQQLPQDPKKK